MSYKNFILFTFLLSLSSASLAMDPPMAPPIERQYPLDFQPMKFADDDDDEQVIEPHPRSIPNNGASTFEGVDVKDLKTVFENAPDKAKRISRFLKNKALMNQLNYSTTFLVGDHGTGKTVLAKAIAYELCSTSAWTYEYISSREFMGEYRNQTGVCLRSYLKKIAQLKEPTLLIIDQLNKILEYTESSSDDTGFASDLMCDFLDRHKHNKNLFFIGIMDRGTKLCKRLKSRMLGSCILIKEPVNPELKRIIFTSKCIDKHTQLHPEVTNEWLAHFLAQSPTITDRNLRGLALQVKEIIEKEDQRDEITLITKKHLEMALSAYLMEKKDVEHIDPYEVYIDRVERLHQEQMQQMKLQHQEKMQQMELEFAQERQFRAMHATQDSNDDLPAPENNSSCNIM